MTQNIDPPQDPIKDLLYDYQVKLHTFIANNDLEVIVGHSILDEILRLFDETLTEQKDLQALSDSLHEALNLKHELADGSKANFRRKALQENPISPSLYKELPRLQQFDDELTGFYHCFAIVKEMLDLPEPSEMGEVETS